MTLSRREMLERSMLATAAASLPAAPALARGASTKRFGPNDTVRIATVGVKGRGRAHVGNWLKQKGVQVAGIIDIDEKVIGGVMKAVSQSQGKEPPYFKDLRKAVEDKSIDAISVATCNHTHTLLALWAVQAGKHVYVEKPLSHNVWEGRQLLKAARKYNRIVQHGTQSRSSSWRGVVKYLESGELGKVEIARALCYKRRKSIGSTEDSEPPPNVDFNLWLGPAPVRPYNRNRFHYNWHWHWDYGNGDIGNQGVHQMDIARWGLGKAGLPKTVQSVGARLGYRDQAETPNTQIALMNYGDGQQLIFEVRGLETGDYLTQKIGNIFHCENGYVAGHTAFDKDGKKIKNVGGDSWGSHFENFIAAIRAGNREDQTADVGEGHPSAALCHLPHISHHLGTWRPLSENEPFDDEEANRTFHRTRKHLADNGVKAEESSIVVGPKLTFDPETERFPDHVQANKLLTRAYRPPFVVPEEV